MEAKPFNSDDFKDLLEWRKKFDWELSKNLHLVPTTNIDRLIATVQAKDRLIKVREDAAQDLGKKLAEERGEYSYRIGLKRVVIESLEEKIRKLEGDVTYWKTRHQLT